MQHIAIVIQLLNNPKYVTHQTVTINQFDNNNSFIFKAKNLDETFICYVNENTLQIVLNYDNNIQGILKIDRLLDINMYIRDKKSKTRFVALQLRQSILAKLGQIAMDVLTLCKV